MKSVLKVRKSVNSKIVDDKLRETLIIDPIDRSSKYNSSNSIILITLNLKKNSKSNSPKAEQITIKNYNTF